MQGLPTSGGVETGGVTIGVGVGFGDCATAGFTIVVPLSQTSFFPDLIQVNFLVEVELVRPAFEHAAPATGVAAETLAGSSSEVASTRAVAKEIFLVRDANSARILLQGLLGKYLVK